MATVELLKASTAPVRPGRGEPMPPNQTAERSAPAHSAPLPTAGLHSISGSTPAVRLQSSALGGNLTGLPARVAFAVVGLLRSRFDESARRMAQVAEERSRQAAFEFTSRFEARSPADIQTADAGIVSFGPHQASLASGTLGEVLDTFLSSSSSANATQLSRFQPRVIARDPSLRYDRTFHALLRAAAVEPAMAAAEQQVFTRRYWVPAVRAANTLGFHSSDTQRIFFDTLVQGGFQTILRHTLNRTGASPGSEREFQQRFLENRRTYLNRVAESRRLAGRIADADMLQSSAQHRVGALLELLPDSHTRTVINPE